MNLKSIAVAFLAVVCVASFGQAPAAAPVQGVTVKKFSRWKVEKEVLSQLDLNPTQKDQIKEASKPLTDDAKAMKAEKKSGAAATEEETSKAKQKEDRKAYLGKLKTILTPAQWIQYTELHKQLKEKAQAANETPTKP